MTLIERYAVAAVLPRIRVYSSNTLRVRNLPGVTIGLWVQVRKLNSRSLQFQASRT